MADCFPDVLDRQYTADLAKHVRELAKNDVPEQMARRIAKFIPLSTAFDMIEISKTSKQPVPFVAKVYFEIGSKLELMWIRQKVATLPVDNHWHNLAKSRLSDDIHSHQYAITSDAVRDGKSPDPSKVVVEWMQTNNNGCRMLANIISDMKSLSKIDFATLSVAISEVYLLSRVSD